MPHLVLCSLSLRPLPPDRERQTGLGYSTRYAKNTSSTIPSAAASAVNHAVLCGDLLRWLCLLSRIWLHRTLTVSSRERLLVLLGFANGRERIDGLDTFDGKIIGTLSILLLVAEI